MKIFKILFLVCLLLPSLVLAQSSSFVRNDTAATTLQNTNLQPSRVAVDSKGRIFINPGVGATDLGKAEDAPFVSGDTGVAVLGIRNDAGTTLTANGDYAGVRVNPGGSVMVDWAVAGTDLLASSFGKREDDASASGDGGVAGYTVRADPLAVSSGSNADYQALKSDNVGRLIVTPAPANETWSSCSASSTGTANTTLKGFVSSNRIYVTSISCYNTAAVASYIDFKNDSARIYAGGIGNSTLNGVASYVASFPVPLRLPINNDFNFAMGTTATATTCCAAGYTSVD